MHANNIADALAERWGHGEDHEMRCDLMCMQSAVCNASSFCSSRFVRPLAPDSLASLAPPSSPSLGLLAALLEVDSLLALCLILGMARNINGVRRLTGDVGLVYMHG